MPNGRVITKWYNRDSISDQDMKRSEEVAARLLGRKVVVDFPFGWEPAPQWAKDAKEDDLQREGA